MAGPVLTKEQWDEVRLLSIKGIPDSQICETYGIRSGTLYQRRYNDSAWLALWRAGAQKPGKVPEKLLPEGLSPAVQEAASMSLEELAQNNPLLLAQYTHSKIKEAVQSDSLPTPSSWGELKTASEIFRKAVGLDKEQSPVQINLWGTNQDGLAAGPTIDVTPPEPESWV